MKDPAARPVASLMSELSPPVDPDDPLEHAEALMGGFGVCHWPVARDGKLLGIISLRDLLVEWQRRVRLDELACARGVNATAGTVMGLPALYVRATDDLLVGAELLSRHRLSCLPIVDKDQVVGVLTLPDFVHLAVKLLAQELGDGERPLAVEHLMTPAPLVTVQAHARLSTAEIMMRHGHVRQLPVLEGDRLVGLLSDHDLLAAVHANDEPIETLLAAEVMTRSPPTIEPQTEAALAGMLLLQRRMAALPVVAGSRLVGILARSDFLSYVRALPLSRRLVDLSR